jgi:uncharacterized repeat protein (TIGR01451 family)/LPXTG-motif cell wall-anchored protein
MSISTTKIRRAALAMALLTGTIIVFTQSSASAKAAADLDQCANIGPTCDTDNPAQWQNGNLGSSQSSYSEGDAVPYRTEFTGLTAGSTYAVSLGWETTKGGKRALDYLTTYDYSETTADPCAGLTCPSPTSLLPIPVDPDVGAQQVGGQNFTLFGGTFPAAGTSVPNTGTLCATDPCVISSNPSAYSLSGDYTGDSKREVVLYFTASSTSAVLAWGGHIASSLDWGIGNSASMISGSPYHMILGDFDCSDETNCSTGEQDRSLSSEAVISPASITVVKQASVEGSAEFNFTASPSPLSSFSLVDDGTTANTKVFPGITNFTTYTVTEQTLPYWDLTNVSCVVTSPNGGTQTVVGSQVTIVLKESENVTCTYSNTSTYAPELSLTKSADPTTYTEAGETITYTYTLTNTGNAPLGPDHFKIDDDKINGGTPFNCGPADTTLAVDATLTCTADYTITSGDIAAESVTNVAFGTGGGQTTGNATATVLYADLSIAKSASPTRYLAAGDTITYTYTLTNTGNTALGPTQFKVDDDKINGGTPFNCGAAGTTLAIDATITCTANYTITTDDVENESVTNTAFGTGAGLTTDTVAKTVSLAAMSISKTATPTTYVAAGETILYTYVLTNTGAVPLGPDQFTVTDDKINGGTPFNCGPAATTLAVDATVSCTSNYTITTDDIESGLVTNNAYGSGDGVTTNETSTTVRFADLSISKQAAPATYTAAGQVITYTYTLTNTGNAPIGPSQFKVDDDKINGGTPFNCGAAGTTLAIDATITCTANYTVTADDVESGSVTNVAFGTGGGITTPMVSVTVTYKALSISKQAAPTSYSAAGQIITYTYTLTNTGNTVLGPTQFTVSDDKINGGTPFNCGPAATTLAVGATTTCTADYTITLDDVDEGSVTNTAYGNGAGLTTPAATTTVTYAELDLNKTANPATYKAIGDTVTYTYTITNSGNTVLGPTQFKVDDDKIDEGAPFNCGAANTILAISGSVTCTRDYVITTGDVTNEYVTNAAFATGAGLTSPTTFATVNLKALSISKQASPTSYSAVGQIITYTYTLTNVGNAALGPDQFSVSDDKVNGGTPFACGEPGTTLAVAATVTCSAEYTITSADVEQGVVTNSAYGMGDGVMTTPVAASVTYAAIDLDKSASPTTYTVAGEVVTYTYTITNSGNTVLGPSQFEVDDDRIDGGTPFDCGAANTTLAIGASVTCSATYTVTAADVSAGSVTNAAFATGGGLTSPTTFATVNLKALSITKSAAPSSYDATGDTITYTYTLTNTGSIALGPDQFTITDNKINAGAPFSCGAPGTTLAIGASVTCSATYTVTAADVSAGSIANVATGSGGGVSTPPATATVAFVPPPTTTTTTLAPTTTTTTLAPTTTTTTPELQVIFPAPTTTAPPEDFAVLFPLPQTGNDATSSWWLLALVVMLGGALMVTARLMRRRPE